MKKKILIVEDEVLVGMMLSSHIEGLGFTVVDVVTSGKAAITAVKAHLPDVVLMDISLNGPMDGIDAAVAIKEIQDIPIIFYTGYQDEKLMERVQVAQPAAILDKLGPTNAIRDALESIFN